MEFVRTERRDNIAAITLARGKVNAINQQVVDELRDTFQEIESDESVRGVVLTGQGKFFSFGLDVPALYDLSPGEFTDFLRSYCAICTQLFLYPKPIIAAVNGHAVAGGCILMLPCDRRIAADGPMAIVLNEVTLGAGLFASTVEMLRFWIANVEAEAMLLTGKTIDVQEALRIGLVQRVVEPAQLMATAIEQAKECALRYGEGYKMLRRLIREPITEKWKDREQDSIAEFVRIWYSPETREKTKRVQIRS